MAPLAHVLMRRRDPVDALASFQVRDVDVRALSYLSTVDAMPMRQLAGLLQVTPGRVTQIVDRLESTGHVVRERDPADRRVWQVRITGPAREIIDGYYGRRSLAVEESLEDLSPDERAAVVRFLESVVSRLSRIEQVERPAPGPGERPRLRAVS